MRVHTKSFESEVVAEDEFVATKRVACMSEDDFDDACSVSFSDFSFAANDFNESYF